MNIKNNHKDGSMDLLKETKRRRMRRRRRRRRRRTRKLRSIRQRRRSMTGAGGWALLRGIFAFIPR